MLKTEKTLEHKQYNGLILAISIIVPVLVAVLLFMPYKISLPIGIVSILPGLNAVLNSITSVLLIAAVIAIKKKRIIVHKRLMLSAFGLGAIFLISYVLYHAAADSTVFGDLNANGVLDPEEKDAIGSKRGLYVFFLLTHILLAIVVLPFVLYALFNALTEQFDKHKKVVKFAFPIWLYVSVTGVIVYLMISPYYSFS